MRIINAKDAEIQEYPFYSMITGIVNEAHDSEVTIGTAVFKPNARVPETGFGVHDFDEYSFIIEGQLEAQIEDQHVKLNPNEFSFIGKGEKHWSFNNSDKECKIVWVSVKKTR